MAVSTVMSVGSFSVVLAEAFAAVGLSTLVPATVVTAARLAKAMTKAQADRAAAGGDTDLIEDADKRYADAKTAFGAIEPTLRSGPLPLQDLQPFLNQLADSVPSLDLLLPHDAKIHAEFTFEGRDATEAVAEIGGQISVVSVRAGFSALYEAKSTNKISLDVNFVSVNVPL
jgi:hypothetical protein